MINKEEFEKLSKAEQRIAICKDVIQRIDNQKIVEHHDNFWHNRPDFYDLDVENITPQEFINMESCSVCAKGALMCSWVGNFDEVGWDAVGGYREELEYRENYPKDLREIFGRKMLDDIEAAFENSHYMWHYDENKTSLYALAFCMRDNSLRGIMQYIIENDGEFPLPKEK